MSAQSRIMNVKVLRRIAWAGAVCVGPLAALLDLAGARDITNLRAWEISHAVKAGFAWALIAAPVILLLYYACKYVLTGRLGNAPDQPSSATDQR